MSANHKDLSSGEDGSHSPVSPKADADAAVTEVAAKSQAKKRTKTGCLTCRKRRIKCGEERPVCKNCIKSKRECLGYAPPAGQRLQDQRPGVDPSDPSAVFAADPYYSSQNQPEFVPEDQYTQYPPYHAPSDTVPQLFPQHVSLPQQSVAFGYVFDGPPQDLSAISSSGPGQAGSMPSAPPVEAFHMRTFPIQLPSGYGPVAQDSSLTPFADTSAAQPQLQIVPPGQQYFNQPPPRKGSEWSVHSSSHNSSGFSSFSAAESQFRTSHTMSNGSTPQIPTPPNQTVPTPMSQQSNHRFIRVNPARVASNGTSYNEEEEEEEEDRYDKAMDDEIESSMTLQDAEDSLNDLLEHCGYLATNSQRQSPTDGGQNYAVGNIRQPFLLSALHDDRNKLLFCHFVEKIGQYISLSERNFVRDPAQVFWSTQIPALAMKHPALAHSILAVSAQQLSRVYRAPADVATRHWGAAVKRVGKLVGQPSRRIEIATLATIVMLSLYEVLVADHSRWILHLAGATKLVQEHDFAGVTRVVRRMRAKAKLRIKQVAEQYALTDENYVRTAGIPEALLNDQEWEFEPHRVAQFTGLNVDYDSQTQPNFRRQRNLPDLTEKEVEDYKLRMDLRWWYCKCDVIQSLISGDQLLMPYDQWKYCPPRGMFGKAAVPFATYDYLTLIMARLADFGGKDRARKLRAMAAHGGKWQPPSTFAGPVDELSTGPTHHGPPAGMHATTGEQGDSTSSAPLSAHPRAAGLPSANEGRVRQSKPPQVPEIPMLGMIPPPAGPVHMPSSFHTMSAHIHDESSVKPIAETTAPAPRSIEEETAQALAEHTAIAVAFQQFAASLGPEFQPLPSERSLSGPFGPHIRYSNPAIASMWALYYVGLILIQRLHPHMPAAAMLAAGVAAQQTVELTQIVGRICTGMTVAEQDKSTPKLAVFAAAATIDSTFPLLFAGIIYQDAEQRKWTIDRLMQSDREYGWKTGAFMASACEQVWMITAEQGRGPPYEKTILDAIDDRLNGTWAQDTTNPVYSGDAPPVKDAIAEHESRYVIHDRRQIGQFSSTRLHWALGILGVEQDMQKLKVSDHT